MTQLTLEEIEMMQREAREEYPVGTNAATFSEAGYIKAATKYLLQLKEERERAGKLFTEDEVCTIYDLFVIEKRQSFRSVLQEYKNKTIEK